ncbi:MAG: hypothetical protein WAT92_00300 [Saprospiraceae bacterium]
MAAVGNDEYNPTCGVSCSAETLLAVGETDCVSENSLELSEINELFLDTKSATFGTPTNPVASYTIWTDNESDLLTWYAAKSNVTAAKVRFYYGRGEKPEPTETTLTLRKNKIVSIGTRHTLVYTIDIIDQTTYQALRQLQACKGQFHAWFSTDTYFYGGDNGVIVDVEKVVFPKTGGRGENAKCIITLSWSAKADPVRDIKPWS